MKRDNSNLSELVLYNYQKDGIVRIIEQLKAENGFLLCDEMGLGKTIQALETAKHLELTDPVLIIAPSSCIRVWSQGDIKKFPEFTSHVYIGPLRKHDPKAKVSITSYDTLLIAYKTYMHVRLDTGQLSNDEIIRFCQVNNLKLDHLQHLSPDPNIYRRELLTLVRKANMKEGKLLNYNQSDLNFMQQKWGLMIMDEVHKIKNPKSNRCHAIGFINTDYRLGLTGTPIMNHAEDLFSIWKFGLGLFHLDYEKIKRDPNSAYCQGLIEKYMLRRVKSDIEELKTVLPKRMKTNEDQVLPWFDGSEQKNLYIQCKQESLQMYFALQNLKKNTGESTFEFNGRKKSLNMTFIGKMQTLRQICLGILPHFMHPEIKWSPSVHSVFHPWIQRRVKTILLSLQGHCKDVKFSIIREFVALEQKLIQPSPKMMYVYNLLQTHRKIIVFSTFKTFLKDVMQPWLRQIGVLSSLFCGGKRNYQDKALKMFETEEDVRVLLIVKTAGAEGLNLQKMANICVIMDPHFNLALDEQAAQRIDRIGQEKEVIVRKLYMEGSVDEAIKKMQEVKQIDIEAWNKKDDVKTIRTHGLYLQKYDTVK